MTYTDENSTAWQSYQNTTTPAWMLAAQPPCRACGCCPHCGRGQWQSPYNPWSTPWYIAAPPNVYPTWTVYS